MAARWENIQIDLGLNLYTPLREKNNTEKLKMRSCQREAHQMILFNQPQNQSS